MIKNYLRVALRSLMKNKSYVIINTLGLGIALACCVSAYLFLAYNIEFDNFHKDEKVARIYKVHADLRAKDGKVRPFNGAPMILAPTVSRDISGIERYTRYVFNFGGGFVRYGDNAFSQGGIAFADSTFFEMFDFPFVKGTPASFRDKQTILINEEMAIKYFGDKDPIGEILTLYFANDKEIKVVVQGVIGKVPLNNTFTFNAIIRIEHYLDINSIGSDSWSDWRDPATFLELTSKENASTISAGMNKYIPIRNEAKKDTEVVAYRLEPFKSTFTFDEVDSWWANLRISFLPLLVFSCMALLILLIACFNLTNTSIAMTARRLKEVGVRKTVGAAKWQIVSQFLFETMISILMALLVGLAIAQLIVPAFSDMWNLKYGMQDLNGVNLFITLVIIVFVSSLLAGIYPALFNSKFQPVALLKGTIKVKGTNLLTRTLVGAQFALSVIVLVAGVVFIQNTKYQEKIRFGYEKEKVLLFPIQSEAEIKRMEGEILRNPKVLNYAVSDHNVGSNNYLFPVTVDTTEYESRLIGVGKNYFETMGFTFMEGRPLDLDNATDQLAIVVNQAFVEKVNLEDPLNQVVTVHDARRKIVGVIENHVDNLFRSKEPEPFLFYAAAPADLKIMLVSAEEDDLSQVNDELKEAWDKNFPSKPFESSYQEDVVMQGVKSTNANLKQIFLFLTILGGLLSASGIFALASLNIEKRSKEIGIRKALGASVNNIIILFNREFVVILSIAVSVGSTGGYFLTAALLDEIYAYHIAIGLLPVALCALFIFGVGILTTSLTILGAASTNPVETLRDE